MVNYEEFILMDQCVNHFPLYLGYSLIGNLEGALHFFCSLAIRNTQKLIKTKSDSDDIFKFQSMLAFLSFLFGPINFIILVHHKTINFM